MSHILCRPAVASEQKALEALQWRASLGNAGDRDALLANPDAIELPLNQIMNGQVFVAEQDGVVVGFAAILARKDGGMELDGLFVEPPFWKQGIGRLLVEHCAQAARTLGSAWLHVIGNPHAEGFYAACGFERIGTTDTRFGVGLSLRKTLALNHPVVSHEEWLAARRALLEREKAFTREGDELSRLQRSLPWERVTKDYVFDGPSGKETLADLFAGRSQLIVYHFMFHPDDKAGCPHCSLRADGFAGLGVHLNQRDVTMVVVSRAPFGKLAEYQKRMGWGFRWVSSGGSDFNFDYQASFTPEEVAARRALYNFAIRDPKAREREGHSIFYKDRAGAVFHTYSCYDRGNDKLNLHYHYLDLMPKGRDEGGRGPYWVRRHDEYDR